MTPGIETPYWATIVDCLRQLMEEQGLELGDVSRDTALGADLGVSSVDIIHLLVSLEDRLERPLSFDELARLPDGQFRKDLTAGDLADFVAAKAGPAGAHNQ